MCFIHTLNTFIIFTFIVLCNLAFVVNVNSSEKKINQCEPLQPTANALISCQNETNRQGHEEPEFTCTYSCKNHYIPHDHGSGGIVVGKSNARHKIRCDQSGNWTNLHELRRFTCTEDCGRRVITGAKPLVINGVSTNTSAWPWHAILFRKNKQGDWSYICGGSLIRDSVVLTAAHCVSRLSTGMGLSPDLFRVVLGSVSSNFIENQVSATTQIFEVKQIYIPSSYDNKDFSGDIAIIHLGGNGVRFSDHVIPVCLPNDGALDLNSVHSGRFGDVVGYGLDETGNISMMLKHAELMVVSQSECFASLKQVIDITQFCAGNQREGKKWVTVCNGDSGGGFFVPNSATRRYSIHGIISTGDLDSRRRHGICQQHVIFTRVFPYIFWIRDVLEMIKGEISNPTSGLKYPYTQHGSESHFTHFGPIPRHWDNLVTSIHLSYIYVEPELLFKAIEVNSILEHLNLDHVKFTQSFEGRRVSLPHLNSFVLDIQEFSCWKERTSLRKETNCVGVDPNELTEEKLKSLLFFDKYESEWELEKLTSLAVRIDLTVHIFKIVIVDQDIGKLTLQFPFCSRIVQNINPDFKLKILALRGCNLDLAILLLEEKSFIFANVHTLILNNVTMKGGTLSDLVKRMPNVVNMEITHSIYADEKLVLEFSSLPLKLKHLKLTNVALTLPSSSSYGLNKSRSGFSHAGNIIFPGSTTVSPERKLYLNLAHLETFYCNWCSMDEVILKNFSLILHNVMKLLFHGSQQLDISKLLNEMSRLKRIVFIDIDVEGSEFTGIDRVPGNEEWTNFFISRKDGRWRRNELTLSVEHLLFIYSGGKNFWTSFEEFESDNRLTSFEKIAFTTGKYKFIGTRRGGIEDFAIARAPRIPPAIRNNLKSVEIENAEVVPNELLESLNLAYDIESLILTKVRLLGYFVNFVQLPRLQEYRLNGISDSANFVNQILRIYGVSFYIPFSQSQSKAKNGGLERYDHASGGATRILNFEISFDDCKMLIIDYKSGVFISTPRAASNFLPDLGGTNLTSKIALRLDEIELNSLSIPTKIQNLNIRCKSVQVWNCSRILTSHLHPLDSLIELRLALHHIYEEHAYRNSSTFKLSDISRSANTLQVLSIKEANLEFSPGVYFPSLRTILFDTCILDTKILKHFFQIFPALEEIGILSYNYAKYGPVIKEESTIINKRIVNELMETPRVRKISANLAQTEGASSAKIHRFHQMFWEKLKEAGLKEFQFDEFIIIRNNKTQRWEPFHLENTTMTMREIFDQEIHQLKGDSTFGPPSCTERYY